MKGNEILILTVSKSSATYSTDAKAMGISMDTFFAKKTLFLKIISRIDRKLSINSSSFFYKKSWKNALGDYKQVILVAHPDSIGIVSYLNKNFPDLKVIIWYNNPIKYEISPKYFLNKNCEVWTFDLTDAKKYNLKYNRQYIDVTPIYKVSSENNPIIFDIVFVGQDKGRLNELLELKNTFESNDLTVYYHITESKDSKIGYNYQKNINYQSLLRLESQSKVILEILQKGQKGISLRPLEALFLNKKLITNNPEILNEDFYCSENIFIIGVNNKNDLKKFVQTPLKPISPDVILRYSFENWIKNFFDSQ